MTRRGSDAFVRRRWAARLGRIRGWLILLAAVIVAGAAAWVVFASSLLGVSAVHVSGEREVTAAEVRTAASVPQGQPLARVDLGAIRQRVEKLPRVESAQVSRAWPRGVKVVVRERTAIAVVTEDDSIHALDRHGVLFEDVGSLPKHLPRITITARSVDRADALAEVAKVVAALDPSIARKVERVKASSMDSITFVMRNGDEVRWGSSAQAARKAEILKSLLKLHARTYDVTAPERPTTRT